MSNPAINKPLAQQLICACIQTYKARVAGGKFTADPLHYIGNPKGLTYVDYFKGKDIFDKHSYHKDVLFGLIFSVNEKPGQYVFAFRGTWGAAEWWDDLRIAHKTFVPLRPNSENPIPEGAHVEEGFWEIYQSLQKTVFEKIDSLQIKELVITGHSLGSSLCELFTLDVAISTDIPFTTYNFACPRTGNRKWARIYNGLTKRVGNPTIRVVNKKDIVPKLPPSLFGYRHVGEAYKISFDAKVKSEGFLPNYGLRHSADNYARTLAHNFGTTVACQLESEQPVDLKYG